MGSNTATSSLAGTVSRLACPLSLRDQVPSARYSPPHTWTGWEEICGDVSADCGARLAEFDGEPGHGHLLVNISLAVAISRLASSLTGVPSRRLRQEFPDLRRHYWRASRLWSRSYFAGPADGAPIY